MLKKVLSASLFLIFIMHPLYAEQPNANIQTTKNSASDTKQLAAQDKTNNTLDETTPKESSALEERLQKMRIAEKNPLSIIFYRPTYVLPFYYTTSPNREVYRGNTPNEQNIMHSELKAQLSLLMPVLPYFFNDYTSLNIGYTQLSYWQIYASSQYFRETNYEPEIFVQSNFRRNWLLQTGLDHQSNGRGGTLERSWNRAILGCAVSGENWVMGLKAWALIFKAQSSDAHNPNIAHYLGYDMALFSYRFHKIVTSLQVQNLESGLARGSIQFTVSYPISKHFLIYTQYFNGYGQSLIEYNHKTQSAGIGIAFNDWI